MCLHDTITECRTSTSNTIDYNTFLLRSETHSGIMKTASKRTADRAQTRQANHDPMRNASYHFPRDFFPRRSQPPRYTAVYLAESKALLPRSHAC